jgi:hypothetical protein
VRCLPGRIARIGFGHPVQPPFKNWKPQLAQPSISLALSVRRKNSKTSLVIITGSSIQTMIRSLWVNFSLLRIGLVATLAFTSRQAGLLTADAASQMCGLMLRLHSWFTPFGAGANQDGRHRHLARSRTNAEALWSRCSHSLCHASGQANGPGRHRRLRHVEARRSCAQ